MHSNSPPAPRHSLRLAIVSLLAMAAASGQAEARLVWGWSYSGVGIAASGIMTTADLPDAAGYYPITGISGVRNGETITGLQPTGTPIPGNEPFHVDNLIRLIFPQLTGDGLGYSTAGGNYVSPFFASFLPTPGYLEVFSAPPLVPGFENLGPEDSELPVVFTAAPIPGPGVWTLMLAGLGGVAVGRRSAARTV